MTEIRDWAALRAAVSKKVEGCTESCEASVEHFSFEDAACYPDVPQWAYEYAYHVIRDRWPEAEPVIASDPQWAHWYARNVIKGRWPEAEAVIAESPQWACWYARYVLKGRWPEVEAVIAKSSCWAQSPYWSQYYARFVAEDRWPKTEPDHSGATGRRP